MLLGMEICWIFSRCRTVWQGSNLPKARKPRDTSRWSEATWAWKEPCGTRLAETTGGGEWRVTLFFSEVWGEVRCLKRGVVAQACNSNLRQRFREGGNAAFGPRSALRPKLCGCLLYLRAVYTDTYIFRPIVHPEKRSEVSAKKNRENHISYKMHESLGTCKLKKSFGVWKQNVFNRKISFLNL